MTAPPELAGNARQVATRSTEVELFSLAGHDGHLREANGAFAELLGLRLDQVNGRSLLELVHPEDVGSIVAGLAALEGGAAEVLLENRFRQGGDRWVYLQWVARPLEGTELWWAAGRDTTEFHRLLAERLDLRARLDLALGQATAALWELDMITGVLTWEDQAAEVLGVGPSMVPTTTGALAEVIGPGDVEALEGALARLAATGTAEVALRVGPPAALRHLSLRGKVLDRDRRGRAARAVGLVLDVTTEKAMEEQMLRMVMSDALTGVPNRRAFDASLRSEWRRCSRAIEPLTVAMVDIDDFKSFNDTFGHLVGDDALCAVARALAGVVQREGDVLARFGGEEFAVVLPGTGPEGAQTMVDRLVEAVRGVTIHQAAGWRLSVSVGAATWQPGSAVTKASELLTRADEALYAAKGAGKDRAVISVDPRMADVVPD